jgi:hypothetical protein
MATEHIHIRVCPGGYIVEKWGTTEVVVASTKDELLRTVSRLVGGEVVPFCRPCLLAMYQAKPRRR